MRSSGARPTAGFTLVELMVVVAVIGLLAAIAIPAFARFQAKAKKSEARVNLRAWVVAEEALYMEKERYSSFVQEIGFAPERGNRFAYVTGQTTALVSRDTAASDASCRTCEGYTVDTFRFRDAVPVPPASFAMPLGVVDTCPRCTAQASARGNVDNDGDVDEWIAVTLHGASDADLTAMTDGDDVMVRGEPYNIVED